MHTEEMGWEGAWLLEAKSTAHAAKITKATSHATFEAAHAATQATKVSYAATQATAHATKVSHATKVAEASHTAAKTGCAKAASGCSARNLRHGRSRTWD